jgi:hypothetical protein
MPDGRRLSDEELAQDAHGVARIASVPVRPLWQNLHSDVRTALVAFTREVRLKWYIGGEATLVDDLGRAVAPSMQAFLSQLAKRLREEAQRAE